MSKEGAKSLSQLIGAPGSGLSHLAAEARQRSNLSEFLRTRLDPTLSGGLLHCDIRADGTLVAAAANPEWASRLRFESAELRRLCAEFGTPVTGVKVRVAG